METIDYIIQKAWYESKFLLEQRALWVTNWMWAKRWINISKLLRSLPWFDKKKQAKLIDDLDLISDLHDIDFGKWGNYKDFYNANLNYIKRVLQLLHWTPVIVRLLIFILFYTILNTVWMLHFNWKSNE